MSYYAINNNELYHHGIKGQKWGVRRFQNEDGSVTAKGAKRYYDGDIQGTGGKTGPGGAGKHKELSARQKANKKMVDEAIREHEQMKAAKAAAKAAKKQAKAEKKARIKENTKQINDSRKVHEKLIYGKDIWKDAAKRMEKENISMDQAVKDAKYNAWINTAAVTAAMGIAMYTINHG